MTGNKSTLNPKHAWFNRKSNIFRPTDLARFLTAGQGERRLTVRDCSCAYFSLTDVHLCVRSNKSLRLRCTFKSALRLHLCLLRLSHIKLWLLLWFEFFKTMDLLLSVLRDASVRYGEIVLGLNPIPWGNCRCSLQS